MNKQAGIWIDHKGAFIVFVGEGAEEAQRLESGMEKHVRFSGHAAEQEGSADDQRDRQFAAHLGKYYDEVIAHVLGDAIHPALRPGGGKGRARKTSRE